MKEFTNAKILALFLALILVIASGCSSSSSNEETGNTGSSSDDSGSNEETFTITLAHSGPSEGTGIQEALLKLKNEIEEKSDGRIKFELYPNGQLGGEREVLEGVQNGNITATFTTTGVAGNFVPEMEIFDIPFVLESKEQARHAIREGGPVLEKLGPKFEEKGLKLLGFGDEGFRVLSTKDLPVKSVEDLKGLKVRTQESSNHIDAWNALETNPTPIPFPELYTALQQGTVDAQETPFEIIAMSKLYEVQKYAIDMKMVYQYFPIMMNLEFYQSLPDDLKAIVDDCFSEALQNAIAFTDERDEEYVKTLEDNGVEVSEITGEGLKPFREKAQPIVLKNVREKIGDELVDLYLEEASSK
ncbi:TRAP transporter substrate-binding protein [Pueribacillus theae]|uniref:TRAP transporter substrate-binding protein n=1 Tax=Pueribacillus theae TaxID=2171751 RepID=UPI0014025180|nr:TRAP transporter substrate-binding protein [Pueribacillus theae]